MAPQHDDTPPQRPPPPERLIVGRIVRPWGARGQVKVEPLTDFPERFRRGARFLIGDGEYRCSSVMNAPRNLVLKLDGVDSPDAAEALRGALLEVPTAEAPALPEGTYYHYQLMGLEVRTAEGEELGRVVEVLTTGGTDVYVVHGPRGEVLLPATSEVVASIDLEAGRMTVTPLPGMVQG